jgi:hypothetical protein
VQVIWALHDLQGEPETSLGPGDQLAGVAAISPGQLMQGKSPPQVPQQRQGGVAVLNGRGGDQHRQQ